MSYTLDYTRYIPSNCNMELVQGIKGNKVPRGAIKGGNGTFIVQKDYEPAIFYMFFKDPNGNTHCYNAYYTIKSNMLTERLTQKRREKIEKEVGKIAQKSTVYDPERWIEEAVRKLKI